MEDIFYPLTDFLMDIKTLTKEVLAFRDARDRKQFHNPKDLATAIAIEASELQEKFLRKSQEKSYEIGKNDLEVREEIADIFNFLLLFAEVCDIDLGKELLDKMEQNNKKYPVEKAK
jgi:NTP pyrophosphatase (non-canonical NTP hydrolase)